MRKKILSLILVISLMLLSSCADLRPLGDIADAKNVTQKSETEATSQNPEAQEYIAVNHETVRAIWLSQFDMYSVYTENGNQRAKASYTKLVKQIVSNVSALGFNTVFIQLRPNGDSVYPSEIYPPSKYVCGSYAGSFSYDPFEIFLELAHNEGLSVHGWINPMRCMSEDEITQIDTTYKLSEWYANKNTSCLVLVNGRYYINPAYSEARSLICDGAAEILQKYDIDGIHIDDYFYPTTDESFDRESYLSSKSKLGLAEFRRQNINKLVKELYDTVKKERPSALFGVSPGGNTERNYNTLYADTARWCAEEGYIDYICPQVYFGFEHSICAFDKVCDEFSQMIKTDSVKLIIGMTLGKAVSAYDGGIDTYAGEGKNEWIDNKDVLARAFEYTENLKNCVGVSYFSYQYFYDPVTSIPNQKSAEELTNLLPLLTK